MSEYNYEDFIMANEAEPFEVFPKRLHVGEKAPNFALEDLATGQLVELKHLWRKQSVVMEFGSFT